MGAISTIRDCDRDSLHDRIARLQADRIDISIDAYHGAGSRTGGPFNGSSAICFVILWVGLLLVGRERMLHDPGTFWHTVVGERMLDGRQWITTDPFSFTFQGRPWIAQQWLAECAMALVHQVAGLDGILLGAVTILAATFAWLFSRLRRAGMNSPMSAVIIGLTLAASSYHFHPRPHLATMALTAWLLGFLADIESGRRTARWLLGLPFLMVLWTNLHGGALAGVATTILVLLTWAFRSRWPSKSSSHAAPRIPTTLCIIVAVLSGLSILANPYGVELTRVWLSLSTSTVLPQIINEHGPTRIGSIEGLSLAVLGLVYLLFLSGWRIRDVRVTWLIPLLWLPLAFMRVRHGPLFAVTSVVAIADMWPTSRTTRWLAKKLGAAATDFRAPQTSRLAIAACAVIVVIAFNLQSFGLRVPVIGAGWATLDGTYWPIEATRVARSHLRANPSKGRIFNDMLFGGYLISELPQARVYIDDRCELYGDDFLLHYVDLLRHPQKIDAEAAARQIDMALVRPDSKMASYLSLNDAWVTLHRDDTAALFSRPAAGLQSIHP